MASGGGANATDVVARSVTVNATESADRASIAPSVLNVGGSLAEHLARAQG